MKTKIEPSLNLDITPDEAKELHGVLKSGLSMEINSYEFACEDDYPATWELIQVLESFIEKTK